MNEPLTEIRFQGSEQDLTWIRRAIAWRLASDGGEAKALAALCRQWMEWIGGDPSALDDPKHQRQWKEWFAPGLLEFEAKGAASEATSG
jgi:hypothetical protein